MYPHIFIYILIFSYKFSYTHTIYVCARLWKFKGMQSHYENKNARQICKRTSHIQKKIQKQKKFRRKIKSKFKGMQSHYENENARQICKRTSHIQRISNHNISFFPTFVFKISTTRRGISPCVPSPLHLLEFAQELGGKGGGGWLWLVMIGGVKLSVTSMEQLLTMQVCCIGLQCVAVCCSAL